MNAPQSVTERYVSNLLHYGRNKEFDIDYIKKIDNVVEDENVGVYFVARVNVTNQNAGPFGRMANGATIQQALRRALEKHGVTFR